MKFNLGWLKEHIAVDVSVDILAEQFTMAGLEVDAVSPVAGSFTGVVVAEIVGIAPHPDADKLRVCQVACGEDTPRQIVCGAANASRGLKVPLAKVGASLPGEMKITQAKLRGIESSGMLCSAKELGMADEAVGLLELPADAPVGMDIRKYLELDDTVFELNVTPNRGDCLSIVGLAREVAAVNSVHMRAIEIPSVAAGMQDTLVVNIKMPGHCPRYAGRIIRNINNTATTPVWMTEKLRRAGVRCIDPIVDVTNYVLLELGQPMHAFDLEKLDAEINVRLSVAGEKIHLLDGQEVMLQPDTLVIADRVKPIAMAGIMGGSETAVSRETRHIFLESAFFAPALIQGKARLYGLHTESSQRFERGVDFSLQKNALERATALILQILGGEAGPLISREELGMLPKIADITLQKRKIVQYLGVELPDIDVEKILSSLGFVLLDSCATSWCWRVPTWRFDVTLDVDLLEEIARIYGYNRIPVRSFNAPLELKPRAETQTTSAVLRQRLVARGYREVITYSFIAPDMQQLFFPAMPTINLRNPISAELSVMRTSLIPGLVNSLLHNLNRQQKRVRFFECGMRFVPEDQGTRQDTAVAGLVYGPRFAENWSVTSAGGDMLDFYDLKADLEAVLAVVGVQSCAFTAGSYPGLHPGQTAIISRGDQEIGVIGVLHPRLVVEFKLDHAPIVFEITENAINQPSVPRCSEVSRFPEVRRDLAVIVDENLPVQALCKTVHSVAEGYLANLKVFDIYMGKGIEKHRKSVGLGLTFQLVSRTLLEAEVAELMDRILAALQGAHQAVLRT